MVDAGTAPARLRRSASDTAEMQTPVAASLVLHVGFFLIAIFGLPSFQKRLIPDMPPSVSVEFVEVAEETQTNRPPREAMEAPEEKETPPPKAKPLPPKVLAAKPPKLITPRPESLSQDLAVIPPRKPRPPALAAKQAETPKIVPAEKPERKPAPAKEDPKEQERMFNSLLKNMVGSESADTSKEAGEKQTAANAPFLTRMSDQLTVNETDALRQQLSNCWRIMVGARDAQDLVVDIHLVVNPDRTVRSAQIADPGRYERDSFFRAAADSAMRAVRSPYCTPLNLPPNKYEHWKSITVSFNPRDMF